MGKKDAQAYNVPTYGKKLKSNTEKINEMKNRWAGHLSRRLIYRWTNRLSKRQPTN